MNTTALIEQPDTLRPAALASAPARLDIHHMPDLQAWIEENGTGRSGQLVLDCSAVAFIDQTSVEALVAAERDPARRLRIARPSTAMRITFELLGLAMADEAMAA